MSRKSSAGKNNQQKEAPLRLHPFGWAGLLMDIPGQWRLYKVEGSARQGQVGLADSMHPRLEILWDTVRNKGIDAHRLALRHLKRVVGKTAGKDFENDVERIRNDNFNPLLFYRNKSAGLDQCTAYCPKTYRAFEIAYHLNASPEDNGFRKDMLASLKDQPADSGQKWAFYSVSFVAPPGYVYSSSSLNLGDMSVTLVDNHSRGLRPSVSIRQIYPAELALSRKKMEEMLKDIAKQQHQVYRAKHRRWFGHGGIVSETVDTSIGKAVVTDLQLRPLLLPFSWRMPRTQRLWLIHDVKSDRLISINVSNRPEQFAPILQTVLKGLHWAGESAESQEP
jgi:hypothetical protein